MPKAELTSSVKDLYRCQVQGYLKAVKAALYALEENCEVFPALPKTHLRVGDLIAQVGNVMAQCDDEFLTQVR